MWTGITRDISGLRNDDQKAFRLRMNVRCFHNWRCWVLPILPWSSFPADKWKDWEREVIRLKRGRLRAQRKLQGDGALDDTEKQRWGGVARGSGASKEKVGGENAYSIVGEENGLRCCILALESNNKCVIGCVCVGKSLRQLTVFKKLAPMVWKIIHSKWGKINQRSYTYVSKVFSCFIIVRHGAW